MLQAMGLHQNRNNRTLFCDLTFNVEAGSLLWVSGTNGAGKSTLLKVLVGLEEPLSGEITWQGRPIHKMKSPVFLSQLLYIGHKIGIQSLLTPIENLKWWFKIQAVTLPIQQEILDALASVGLQEVADIPCQYLSKGQQQRVALARLWLKPPLCWILDEPFTALDALGQALLVSRFVTHLQQGGCLIVASHYQFDLKPFKYIEIKLPFLKGGRESC